MKAKVKNRIVVGIIIAALTAATAITMKVTYSSGAAGNIIEYMSVPQITVLTHGLADLNGASHWSNTCPTYFSETVGNGKTKNVFHFAYDESSLIWKISDAAGGANIYWAKMHDESLSYNLYDIGYNNAQTYGMDFLNAIRTDALLSTTITDVYRHIVIVFEASDGEASNDTVYAEFSYMLNDVISNVARLNREIYGVNKLPKVNLVGHSRGGITNLQYALDYPQNVASMVSMGTPFGGIAATYDQAAALLGESAGLADVADSGKWLKYYKRWSISAARNSVNSIAIAGKAGNTGFDYCVGVDSQHGICEEWINDKEGYLHNYNFRTKYTRNFNSDTPGDANKLSSKSMAVAHNLEARDSSIITYIINSITISTPGIWGTGLFSYHSSGAFGIGNAFQFNHLRYIDTSNLTFRLTADISLSEYSNWEPLPELKGTLDGCNYTISGMKINSKLQDLPMTDYLGIYPVRTAALFRANNKKIIDLNVSGTIEITDAEGVGFAAGMIAGLNNGEIINCSAQREQSTQAGVVYFPEFGNWGQPLFYDIVALDGAKSANIGGIAGMNIWIISNCTNYVAIAGNGNMGGITGSNIYNITDCTNRGKIAYAFVAKSNCVGGIVGDCSGGKLSESVNYGRIEYINAAISGSFAPKIGQIAGQAPSNGIGTGLLCYGTVLSGNLTTTQSRYVSNSAVGRIF